MIKPRVDPVLAYIFVVQQNKNYDKTMLLTILFGSGSARLGIGILFTMPLALCAVYAAFEDIVGLPTDDNEIEEVGAIGAEL
jgi:hypothetical protein